MIGQDEIIKTLQWMNKEMFPQSNLIIGEHGAGKHTFIDEVCHKFNMEKYDITDTITKEFLDDLYISSNQYVYIIDIVELSKKTRYINKENALLKFIEEPPEGCIIFILVENDIQIISTIRNRCMIWRFKRYLPDTLRPFKKFTNNDIYYIVDTPGKLLTCEDEVYYNELFDLCDKILCSVGRANVSNTLSLEKHFINDDAKYTLEMFLKGMLITVYNVFLKTFEQKYLDIYFLTNDYIKKSFALNVNKKYLFDSYMMKFKEIYDKSE